jgi:DNA repair exonuclease SbcCD ATPase subunit
MEIKIKQINLENFKGIKSLQVDFGEKETSILGKNGTGKTSILDGFTWLLYGKNSQNNADFEIKTLSSDNEPIHFLDHTVSATLSVDGQVTLLKKVYSEKWTKKKGDAEKQFTGHTTKYFFDDVPVKKKYYEEKISNIINEDMFRMITDVKHYNQVMHWRERRYILMELYNSLIDSASLKADEDQKIIIAAKKNKIDKEVDKIPIRIEELLKQKIKIPDDYNHSISELDAQKEKLEAQKEKLSEKMQIIKSDDKQIMLIKEIVSLETEIASKNNEFRVKKAKEIADIKSKIHINTLANQKLETDMLDLKRDEQKTIQMNKNKEQELLKLRKKWTEIANKKIAVSDICPTCNQKLQNDSVKETLNTLRQERSERLEGIKSDAMTAKNDAEKYQIEQTEIEKKIVIKRDEIEKNNNGLDYFNATLLEAEHQSNDLEISDLVNQLEKKNKDLDSGTTCDVSYITEEIQEIESRIGNINGVIFDMRKNASYEKQIKDHINRQQLLCQEFACLEKKLSNIEKGIVKKVESIENQINEKFELCEFKMFRKRINGGIEEICETMINGVPYQSLNNAGKIQAGVDIIRTLQKIYKVYAPIWIDNRESVTEIPDINCQVISLFVSPNNDELNVQFNIEDNNE